MSDPLKAGYFIKRRPHLVSRLCKDWTFALSVLCFLLGAGVSYAGGPALPNHTLTPGVANPILTKAVICAPGFSTEKYRHVTTADKRTTYAEYHMVATKPPCPCEVDHLISLELGGSNDVKNLWPEPYEKRGIPIGAHDKDKLENKLHALLCAGTVDLLAAQKCISGDWYSCYQKYETDPPLTMALSKPPANLGWCYDIMKPGYATLPICGYPWQNDRGNGNNITADWAGSCMGEHGPLCLPHPSPKNCAVIGPGWADHLGATCSNARRQLEADTASKQGFYFVTDSGTALVLHGPYNKNQCMKLAPAPKPRRSYCFAIGKVGNTEGSVGGP